MVTVSLSVRSWRAYRRCAAEDCPGQIGRISPTPGPLPEFSLASRATALGYRARDFSTYSEESHKRRIFLLRSSSTACSLALPTRTTPGPWFRRLSDSSDPSLLLFERCE